ncbi:MAG TPA: hypothetical protein VMJ10_15260, partial [Kofleriaceae bacterium]|nr:hypothetical protein [Kofleriaceae bacterium]
MRMRGVLLAVMASACDHSSGAGSPKPGIGDAQEGVVTKNIPISADLDILFVIDNSASMADKQSALAANLTSFMQALDG